MGATYRGRHSNEFGLAVRTNPMILPEHTNNLTEVPGMPGAHYSRSDYGVGRIPLEITIIEKDIYSYSQKLRMLADWLRPDDGLGAYVADHEPDKTYYAVLESTSMSRIERIARAGEGTIELICPDPFAYGQERTQTLSPTIAYEGSHETYPIFDLTVKKDTPLISIGSRTNTDDYGDPLAVILGVDVAVDETPQERKTLILHDTMQSTSGWTGAENVDNGYVSGQMGVDREGFYVESWGDEDEEGKAPDWIGPSLQRSLPKDVNSFVADILIANRNEFDANGRKILAGVGLIEIYFRDINDNLVAKMAFGDSYGSSKAENSGSFQLDGKRHKFLWEPSGYNDFSGILRVTRDTESWYAYTASMTASGQHYKIIEKGPFVPTPGTAAENRVSKIQVAIRKYIGAQRIYQRIKEIKVWDFIGTYEFPDRKIVEKFNAGDKIRINTGTGEITVNGEERVDLLHVDARMFSFVPGINRLDFNPDEIEGTVTFTDRYL